MKKFLINIIAVIMLVAACFSFTACGEKTNYRVEVKVEVYNGVNDTEEYTLYVDFYHNFAPYTVNTILSYIAQGYYNDAIFYQNKNHSAQIMMGDLAYTDGKLEQKTIKTSLIGEFEKNGLMGSTLKNERGAIGLWRTWTADDDLYKTSNKESMNSGRATWYIPTGNASTYNKNFCVFAKLNLDIEANADALEAIENAFTDIDDFIDYEIYYTGEYDENQPDNNYGLTFNSIEKDLFVESEIDNLFVAEGEQFVAYNHYTVRVPVIADTNTPAVRISSMIIR